MKVQIIVNNRRIILAILILPESVSHIDYAKNPNYITQYFVDNVRIYVYYHPGA